MERAWRLLRTTLDDRTIKCVEMHVMQGLELRLIAPHFGITKERVRQLVKKGLELLKRAVLDEEFKHEWQRRLVPAGGQEEVGRGV